MPGARRRRRSRSQPAQESFYPSDNTRTDDCYTDQRRAQSQYAPPQPRRNWPQGVLAQIVPLEQKGVVVEDFLLGAKQEGLESPNWRNQQLHDYHLSVTGEKTQNSVAGVAALDHHPGGTCPTGADYFTDGRQGADFPYRHHGRDQPMLCVQVGAAISAIWPGGADRQTRPRPPASAAPAGYAMRDQHDVP